MSTHYDVIIVGTGAGGGTLAHRLARSGRKILLLERGDYVPREKQNWDSHAVVLENRYHATMVDTDAYLLEVVRYVHQNPVRAGVTARVGQYRWSSHAAYAGSSSEPCHDKLRAGPARRRSPSCGRALSRIRR